MGFSKAALAAALLSASFLYAAGPLSGRRAPGFSLPDSNNNQHDLQDYRGKVVIVDLMKTDCPHCTSLSHLLERVKDKYAGKVEVISIVTPPDNPNKVKAFIVENKITSPIVFDCGQASISYMQVKPGAATVSLPHLFLVDQAGMIRNDFPYDASSPVFSGEGLFQEVDKLLAAPAAKGKSPSPRRK